MVYDLMMRVALDTLGCKLNQAESELLARQFVAAGYELVASPCDADIYVLNTCTVTHVADAKSRRLLRQAHRLNPGARLVAIGCYAQRAPAELAQLDGVALVLGNGQKLDLLSIIKEEKWFEEAVLAGLPPAQKAAWRTRSFVRIQDGCQSFCTYCVVPLVRPREISLPAGEVVAEVKQQVARGYREVVLTGTKIGSYHYQGTDLKGLLEAILAETDITRLRLSSLQPQEVSPGLIGLWQDKRLCPHCHLSLQSGSDAVLERMGRRYTADGYHQAVSLIRGLVPDVVITTDVIVGFPGETDEEFAASYELCRELGFARMHVFAYSPRQGTRAVELTHQVAGKVKKERRQRMLELSVEISRSFREKFLGRVMPVLWETKAGGVWSGLTGNYIRVYTQGDDDLTNRLLPARLVSINKDGVWGE